MYVRAENAHLLRNFFFAFVVAACISLIPFNFAHAKVVDLSEWGEIPSTYSTKYVFNSYSPDGSIREWSDNANSYIYGVWTELNGSLRLNSMVSNGVTYDKLQVFEILNAVPNTTTRHRIVMLSASGERYGQYFSNYTDAYSNPPRELVFFTSNNNPGQSEDLNANQILFNVHTTPYSVNTYRDTQNGTTQTGWTSYILTPYYNNVAGGWSYDGLQFFSGNPGYSQPNNYGASNYIGYTTDGEIHIHVIYSEDTNFWIRSSTNDPQFEADFSQDNQFQQQQEVLEGIEYNTALTATLQAAANTIISGIKSSLDELDYDVYQGINAIKNLQQTANTLITTANTNLSTISTRISTSNTYLSNINTKLQSEINALNSFGVHSFGDGGSSIVQGINATKGQLENSLGQKQPFYTLNQFQTWIDGVNGLSQTNTYYVDIPIPFAGTVRFDCGSVLNMTVYGNYTIAYFIRYLTSLPILIGCLYVSYKLVMRTFGG